MTRTATLQDQRAMEEEKLEAARRGPGGRRSEGQPEPVGSFGDEV